MICTHCGAKNDDGAVRCHSCHSLLKVSITQEVLDQASTECLSPIEILRICENSAAQDETDSSASNKEHPLTYTCMQVDGFHQPAQDENKTLEEDESDAPTMLLDPSASENEKQGALNERPLDHKEEPTANEAIPHDEQDEGQESDESYQPRHSSGKRPKGSILRPLLIGVGCVAVLVVMFGAGWMIAKRGWLHPGSASNQAAVLNSDVSAQNKSSAASSQSENNQSKSTAQSAETSASVQNESLASAESRTDSALEASASPSQTPSTQAQPQQKQLYRPRMELNVRTEPNLEVEDNIARILTPDESVVIVEEFTVPEYPQLTFGRLEDGYVVCIAGYGESYFDPVEQ